MDVFESDTEFKDVFDIVSSSPRMHIKSNPQYITQILSKLVLADKKEINSVYDPFMRDASSIMSIRDERGYELNYCYGKDIGRLNYIHAIVRLFINDFSFKNVFLKNEDALDSVDINGASFDAILSRVPIAIKNYYSSNIRQNLEISKRSKRSELENILLENFGMDGDALKQDNDLNMALDNLIEKINVENDANFRGEYASLMDSEFLFLINLIDSLNRDGVMAISISENFLFKESLEILRKFLTFEKNYIDTIIRIPNEIIRSRPEVVIVFKKNRSRDEVLFIDMSVDYDTQKTRLISKGSFRKNLLLGEKSISKMCDVFLNKLTIPKFSKLVSLDEIMGNDFNLSVSRYVDTFEGEFIYLDDLASEKEDIESNIIELDLKIRKMMDDLDISF